MKALVLICLVALFHQIFAVKILVVFPHILYGHFKATSTLVIALGAKGHDVTFVTPHAQHLEKFENITIISIEGIVDPIKGTVSESWYQPRHVSNRGLQYTEQVLQNKNMSKLIASKASFDLVIVEDVSAYGLTVVSHIFNCPLVVLLSEPLSIFYSNYIFDRDDWRQNYHLQSAHRWVFNELYREWFILPSQDQLVKNIIPEAPSLRDLLYQTSLILMPSYPTLGYMMPQYPNVKQVGGFHIRPSTGISSRYETKYYDWEHNVTLISDKVPEEIGEVLSKFLFFEGHYTLYTSDASDMGKYDAQLFIGDGDVYDTASAIANNVPVITVSNGCRTPQFLNKILVENGIVSEISAYDLTYSSFSTIAQDMLSDNKKYREKLRQASEIIQTNDMNPLDKAIFWIEYVVKFHGAPHLRPNDLQQRVQSRLIITIIVLTLIDIILFLIFYWIIKHFFKLLRYYQGTTFSLFFKKVGVSYKKV